MIWSFNAEHRAYAARDDVALERVQPLRRALRQIGERNRLRNRDHIRPRVRAERVEAVSASARVAANAAATVPAGVRERMLDRLDAPALLVQHPVVHDAADGQLTVRLDRIILEILVAA